MTTSEVQLLQRELHAIAQRNAQEHQAVTAAIESVRADIGRVYARVAELEKYEHSDAAVEANIVEFKRAVRGWLATAAAIGGTLTGVAVVLIEAIR